MTASAGSKPRPARNKRVIEQIYRSREVMREIQISTGTSLRAKRLAYVAECIADDLIEALKTRIDEP